MKSDVAMAIQAAREMIEAGQYDRAAAALDMAQEWLGANRDELRHRMARVNGEAQKHSGLNALHASEPWDFDADVPATAQGQVM